MQTPGALQIHGWQVWHAWGFAVLMPATLSPAAGAMEGRHRTGGPLRLHRLQVEDSISDNEAVGSVKRSGQTLQLSSCLKACHRGLGDPPHTHTHTVAGAERDETGEEGSSSGLSGGFSQSAHSIAGPVTCSLMVCSHLPTTSIHLCPPHITFISPKPSTVTAPGAELYNVENIRRLFTFKLSTP